MYMEAKVAVSGSTLYVETPVTLAFDPGSKFTAGLLREGAEAIDAFTLALAYPDAGDPNAVLDDHEALRAYTDRITEQGLTLWDKHYAGKPVRVVIEAHNRPRRGGRYGNIPIRDWVIPRMVIAAVTSAFPGAVILPPQRAGGRHKVSNGGTGRPADYYPAVLIGRRPTSWGLNEAHDRVRDHEQAAYTLAGLAELAAAGRAA
jgi:hypothetical protein